MERLQLKLQCLHLNSMNFFENEYTERFFKTDFQNRQHSEGAIMD